jgi:choline dehydrogenase-like flavoprotein
MGKPLYGAALGELMGKYNHIVTAGMLLEDSVVGRVRMGPGGRPLAFYQMADSDAERLVRGTALLSELLFAAGARRIVLPFEGVPDLHSPDDVKALRERRVPKHLMEVMTVHLMGTAAMGGDPKRHVCDEYGRVRGWNNLWVADASLFPSPIGVNPMETIMSLATRNAERMLDSGIVQKAA